MKAAIRRRLSRNPDRGATKKQLFSIGIYTGPSFLDLQSAENVRNPVITTANVTDVPAVFVADPFMLSVNATWYMFFEVMNQESQKGEISVATSTNGFEWDYEAVVLAEPFHLSYPHVFQWRNDFYMIPESYQAESVRLYRASDFPRDWRFVSTLLEGECLLDATPFVYGDHWWLFVETNANHQYDTLRLFHADDLHGRWYEHPQSPVTQDKHSARPAGRVICWGNRWFRIAQDCLPDYGSQVRLFEIEELSTSTFREQEARESPILTGTGGGWNAQGMHHIDAHFLKDGQWLAAVDGWVWS